MQLDKSFPETPYHSTNIGSSSLDNKVWLWDYLSLAYSHWLAKKFVGFGGFFAREEFFFEIWMMGMKYFLPCAKKAEGGRCSVRCWSNHKLHPEGFASCLFCLNNLGTRERMLALLPRRILPLFLFWPTKLMLRCSRFFLTKSWTLLCLRGSFHGIILYWKKTWLLGKGILKSRHSWE